MNSAIVQQREKRLSLYSCGPYQIKNDIPSDFVVSGNNEWPGNSRFLHLDVAALLTGRLVTKLAKHTDQLVPREGR